MIVSLTSGFNLLSWALLATSFGVSTAAQERAPDRDVQSDVKHVAIIGAGAAGASAAYHLRKFAKVANLEVDITVFERSPYIGGRSITVDVYDDTKEPVEVGASIFVEINKILKDATIEFNLSTQPRSSDTEGEGEVLGIWNGNRFVFTQNSSESSWWNSAKILWKYGFSPIRTQRLSKKVVGDFLRLYSAPFFPFRSLSERANDLGLIDRTAITGYDLLEQNGVSSEFASDIVQASTRVNYGQNLGIIHGLETMVCMAIEGAMQVRGGNWRIFDRMIESSLATIWLNTSVTALTTEEDKYILHTSQTEAVAEQRSQAFDSVVIAAPFQFAQIDLPSGLVKHLPDEIPYVTLHVTLFTSPLKYSENFFNVKPGSQIPTTILTTLSPENDPADRGDIVGKTGFFSISNLRTILNPETKETEYLYKIFSPTPVTSNFLGRLFNVTLPKNVNDVTTSASDKVSWYYAHVWKSYPYEYPRVTFEDSVLASGLYYTSGMESFISTMETNALMGMNIAQLLVDDLQGLAMSEKETESGYPDSRTDHEQQVLLP